MCETLGQTNAREETTRILHRGEYSVGMVVGWQLHTALPLLADAEAGTSQRFVWCSALDPAGPDELLAHPGPPRVALAEEGASPAFDEPYTGLIHAVDEVKAEVCAHRRARSRGEIVDPALDAHKMFTIGKIAALLVLLEERTGADLHSRWPTGCSRN